MRRYPTQGPESAPRRRQRDRTRGHRRLHRPCSRPVFPADGDQHLRRRRPRRPRRPPRSPRRGGRGRGRPPRTRDCGRAGAADGKCKGPRRSPPVRTATLGPAINDGPPVTGEVPQEGAPQGPTRSSVRRSPRGKPPQADSEQPSARTSAGALPAITNPARRPNNAGGGSLAHPANRTHVKLRRVRGKTSLPKTKASLTAVPRIVRSVLPVQGIARQRQDLTPRARMIGCPPAQLQPDLHVPDLDRPTVRETSYRNLNAGPATGPWVFSLLRTCAYKSDPLAPPNPGISRVVP